MILFWRMIYSGTFFSLFLAIIDHHAILLCLGMCIRPWQTGGWWASGTGWWPAPPGRGCPPSTSPRRRSTPVSRRCRRRWLPARRGGTGPSRGRSTRRPCTRSASATTVLISSTQPLAAAAMSSMMITNNNKHMVYIALDDERLSRD